MANLRTAEKSAKKLRKPAAANSASHAKDDAIQLLKSDHRQVEEWFEQFENTRSEPKKVKLAAQICSALEVHMTIEEEIFYPVFLESTEEADLHDEAVVEHAGAKRLISEIETGKPGEDMWEAKVIVLGEMIKHHVKEEEQRDGMFARAKAAGIDLAELGAKLAARKKELFAKAE